MSTETTSNVLKPLEAKYVKITDPKKIEEYNKQELYIPPHETKATYDSKLLNDNVYNKSKDRVGQLRPIEISVWEDDPNKESKNSHFRIHLRIMNGRHRYQQDKKWERVYYDFKPIADSGSNATLAYLQARQHFDLQKAQSPEEKIMLLEETAEIILKTTAIPMDKVCNEMVKLFVPQGLMSEVTIRNLCPVRYKDKEMADRKKGHTFEEKGKDTKKKLEAKKIAKDHITKLEADNNKLTTNLTKMESDKIGVQSELTKQMKVVDEVQAKFRIVSTIEDEVECKCGNKIPVKVDVTTNKILAK